MFKERQEIEIETLKTPKGDIPTIKGLESAINVVYTEITSLDERLSKILDFLLKIDKQINEQNQKIGTIGESLANLIVYISKIETQEEQKNEFYKQRMLIEKSDLISLKEDLSRILEQLEKHGIKNDF